MRRITFLILFLFYSFCSFSQHIICPDTVCVGAPASFTLDSATNFASFAWEFGTNSMTSIINPAIPIPGTGPVGTMFSIVDQATMVVDTSNGINHYYAFVGSCDLAVNPSVQRLDFGTDPNSTPVVTDLGNPGNAFITPAYSNLEAVEIVLDETGVFHAFFTNRGLVHWVFGNGLNSPPTLATRIFDNVSILGMGMQLVVLKINGEWVAFAGQTYGPGNIVRFDLGSDLNNIPLPIPSTSLPLPSGGDDLAYFAILKENSNWYMHVTRLTGNSPLFRYAFGTNIFNNSPVVSNLGTTNPALALNRGLNFISKCDSFYLLGLNENGSVLSFNFQNTITNIPSVQSLGQMFGANVNLEVVKPYWYNDTLWGLTGNWNPNPNPTSTIFRLPILSLASGDAEIKYYDPTTTHTFNTSGIYNITLYCDQADPRGPQAFCKQIVVIDSVSRFLGSDTTLCDGETVTLSADHFGATGYLWNTGATTPSIEVNQSGTYWVQVSGSFCINGTDSIQVTFAPVPDVTIQPDDTAICEGSSIALQGSGALSYLWSPSDFLDHPDDSLTHAYPAYTIKYLLTGKNEKGCEGKDSVLITVNPAPDIVASSDLDSVNCNQSFVQLHVTGGINYLWRPGNLCDDSTSANPVVTPDGARTTFYVTGKSAIGCSGSDSISILSLKQPIFFVPNAFSPNGDGLNDQFFADIFCDFELQSLNVYNRWGQLVFRSSKAGEGWDGYYKHKPADMGIYFWYIEGKTEEGKIVKKKGDLLLTR